MSSNGCPFNRPGGMEKNEDVPTPTSTAASTPSEFEQKRIAGFKAMQNRPTGVGYRYPNGTWCGYGISHTIPGISIAKNDYDGNVMVSCSIDFEGMVGGLNSVIFRTAISGGRRRLSKT